MTNTAITSNLPAINMGVKRGILAGLAGGIVFGTMMQMMSMMPMIAGMFGSKSDLIGWMIHLMISSVFGLGYGLLAFRISSRWVVSGMIYGILLWVIGTLILMPLMMGMPLFNFNTSTVMSIMGHMIYGLITAGVLRKLQS